MPPPTQCCWCSPKTKSDSNKKKQTNKVYTVQGHTWCSLCNFFLQVVLLYSFFIIFFVVVVVALCKLQARLQACMRAFYCGIISHSFEIKLKTKHKNTRREIDVKVIVRTLYEEEFHYIFKRFSMVHLEILGSSYQAGGYWLYRHGKFYCPVVKNTVLRECLIQDALIPVYWTLSTYAYLIMFPECTSINLLRQHFLDLVWDCTIQYILYIHQPTLRILTMICYGTSWFR